MKLFQKYLQLSVSDIYLIPLPRGRHATMPRTRDKKEKTKKERIGAEGETVNPSPGS